MTNKSKILVFAGSTRKNSLNKKVIKAIIPLLEEAGAETTLVQLESLPMPLYDGDLEKNDGIPENAVKFKKLLAEHDGLFVASPEYNGFFPAVLKNVIDWASRPLESLSAKECFENKPAMVVAASPGAMGGLRTLISIRQLLTNLKAIVLPQQLAINNANKKFDEQGAIIDDSLLEQLKNLAGILVARTGQLK